MGLLKDELLRVYRQNAALTEERERLRGELSMARNRAKDWELQVDEQHRLRKEERALWDKAMLHHENEIEGLYRQVDDLRDQIDLHNEAHAAVLDLVGAVLEEDSVLDDMFGTAQLITPGIIFTPKPEVPIAETDEHDSPVKCISCGEEKHGYYLCDPCFDLSTDNGSELFEELMDAWDGGARNFPRPGKNAKELYK